MRRRTLLVVALLSPSPALVAGQRKERHMEAAAFIGRHAVTVVVGRTVIAPADFSVAAVRQEVDRFNATVRLAGLPDELQPELLDPAKVTSFLQALPLLDATSTAQIAGRSLRLNMPGMQLDTASAAQPGPGMQLQPLERNDNPSLAAVRLVAPIDANTARARIARARAAVEQCDHRLAAGPAFAPPDLAAVRQQRRAAAMAWLELAGQLASVPGAADEAAREAEQAREALAAHSVPPAAGGMPSR